MEQYTQSSLNPISPTPTDAPKKSGSNIPIIITIIVLAVSVLAVAFFTIHVWSPATCTEPEHCRLCGKTRAPAAGHTWLFHSDSDDITCTLCGFTVDGTATEITSGDGTVNRIDVTVITPERNTTTDTTEGRQTTAPAQSSSAVSSNKTNPATIPEEESTVPEETTGTDAAKDDEGEDDFVIDFDDLT